MSTETAAVDADAGAEGVDAAFGGDTFDVDEYAQRLLAKGTAVSEHLGALGYTAQHLDKQLRKQISTHHGRLLTQATSIESLEDVLETLTGHIGALKLGCDRAVSRVDELFTKTETQTNQMLRMQETCNVARAVIRVLQLSSKLSGHAHGAPSGGGGGRDMVKASLMLQELIDITEETDLRKVEVVEKYLAAVPSITISIKDEAWRTLKDGLRYQNQSAVGNALQVFVNLKCVETEIDRLLADFQKDVAGCVSALGGATAAPPVGRREGGGVTPGGVPLSSVVVHANLWGDVQRLVDCLMAACAQVDVLRTVLSKKKDAATHRPLDERIRFLDNCFVSFWIQLAAVLGDGFAATKGVVRQTLEGEYPKLLRLMQDVLKRVSSVVAGGGADEERKRVAAADALRAALTPLETAYLSKCLSRLFDAVNHGFAAASATTATGAPTVAAAASEASDAPPTDSEIDRVAALLATELDVAAFDARLFKQVVSNWAKTVKLFAVKSEQLLSTDGEASQVIDRPSAGQRRNVSVVNALFRFRTLTLDQQRALVPAAATTLPTDADTTAGEVALVTDAVDQLTVLMSNAVRPLLGSIDDAISAIIDTMHQEDFSFGMDKAEQNGSQCSLYMRELQSFVLRVWTDHLAALHCKDFVYSMGAEVSRNAVGLFLLHASLVRPIGDGGRLKLAADFAQMELAVSPLCRKISTDLGPIYATLRAVRPLLFKSAFEMASCPELGNEVPYWLAIHLIISQSPEELPSPHSSTGWSISRYSEWFREHASSDSDRLQFLKGTVEAYARSALAANKTQYVDTYPLLLNLLKRGFAATVATAKAGTDGTN